MPKNKGSRLEIPLEEVMLDRFKGEREISDLSYSSKQKHADLSKEVALLQRTIKLYGVIIIGLFLAIIGARFL